MVNNFFKKYIILLLLDGSLINCGADFALMPSKFEPGGIV
jgi:hypothetical protein